MALSSDLLSYLRSEIGLGEPPTDDDLYAAWVRLGSVEAVALEAVRSKLAGLRSDPASFAVEGYSQSTAANISSLERQEARLAKAVGGQVVLVPLRRDTR